jgi:hypothetical protein
MSTLSYPGSILNDGLYKLGYVTNDRDHAMRLLQTRLGVEEFVPFAPTFEVTTDDGRAGTANLQCAFSAGRKFFIEVLQPVSGLVEVFSDSLTDDEGFQLVFHHVAVIVDDLAAVKASALVLGIKPAIEASLSTGMSFTYMKLPGLGHWVEHDQYDGNSKAFLDSVACRELPSNA